MIRAIVFGAICVLAEPCFAQVTNAFVHFETAPVHPLAISPDASKLAACNLPDGKLELFDITNGNLLPIGAVPVGIDPVAVCFRNDAEAWVVNSISDSISVIDVASRRVVATIETLQRPSDIVFAGTPRRAFVSCAMANTIQTFDPESRLCVTNIMIDAERPKALAVSPDGQTVYAAIFESGNCTTIVGPRFRNLTFFSNAVSTSSSPYAGLNPPPNSDTTFVPPLNPALGTNVPPASGIIVRKNSSGRWMDDNNRDWTEFVSGTDAPLSQRVPGWDLPDRDLAAIDATTFDVRYAARLMNICMAVGVNPVSGRVAVVGTDAINEVRFEPNLNGVFARVKLALVDPLLTTTVTDLNPHLDYTAPTVPQSERDRSLGDPRAIAWRADGTRAYVAGMGSRNVVMIDTDGNRVGQPIEVGEGPCGLVLDGARQRLYVFNRFSSSISVVDTATDTVIAAVPLFDPTPMNVAIGRRHLYDTRRTSGLGQVACATCHVDARMDRLGWDLGNPAGEMTRMTVNHQGVRATNDYHPMKGVMVTQTLQDIIGHEPFHWRGDKESIEAFSGTFTNLQGAAQGLSVNEMQELRDFLASIRFPPNRTRNFDNSLPTNVSLQGHVALGDGLSPKGSPLPNGNAVAGLATFNSSANFCGTCHTLPTGLGMDALAQGNGFVPIPTGTNSEHHLPLAFRLEGSLRAKIAQFQNLADKVGMDGTRTNSRAGFGFGHDGSVDTLTRFLNGVRVSADQDVANLTAFLLSAAGSDVSSSQAVPDSTPPAAVGRQLTLASTARPALFDAMIALATSSTSRVDLIAKGTWQGEARGWWFDRTRNLFQSDRQGETATADSLAGRASNGSEITLTVVPRGSGKRLGIDRDMDGALDRDEIDAGSNAADVSWTPRVVAASTNVPFGTDFTLRVQVPPLPAAGQISWTKDGTLISGATNSAELFARVSESAAGDYRAVITTPFQVLTSAPVRIAVVPLLISATPAAQSVRRTSNAVFAAVATSAEPVQYEWLFNGQPMQVTNSLLLLTNVGLANDGVYTVVAMNSHGSVTGAPAKLTVLVNPAVVVPPVNLWAVEGGVATFSFMISGNPPPFGFQLRRSSTAILTNYSGNERIGFFTLAGLQGTDAGTYRIVVTNAANPSPGLTLGPFTLNVQSDTDGDSMPDEWETSHALDPLDESDGPLDADGDGIPNSQEYLVGTNPADAQSVLRVSRVTIDGSRLAGLIEFRAASNTTYTVQQSGTAGPPWTTVADVAAVPTNRMVVVTNLLEGASARIYRIVSPRAGQ